MSTEPLMILPQSALDYADKHNDRKKRGHAWYPGTGPEGETCGTCKYRESVCGGRKHFSKCALNRKNWTHGPASDIRMRDPACKFWERAP